MSVLNTRIRGAQIQDATISGGHIIDGEVTEAKLDVYNSPTDGYTLSWSDTQDKFEWTSLGISVLNETPSGLVNGSNTAYTLANTPQANTQEVHLNGLLQEPGAGNDYTVSGTNVTFATAPETGDILLVHYLRNDGFGGGVYLSDVVDDTSPQLGGDLDLNGYSAVYKPSPTNDLEFSGFYATLTVDTNSVGVTSALYMASDGNLDEADADAAASMPCFGLAMETGTGAKKVFQKGYVRNDAWAWTVGGLIYVSTTVGTLTQTAPAGTGDQVQVVGVATHADRMFFDPNFVLAEIA